MNKKWARQDSDLRPSDYESPVAISFGNKKVIYQKGPQEDGCKGFELLLAGRETGKIDDSIIRLEKILFY
jgi:hypothetical protein